MFDKLKQGTKNAKHYVYALYLAYYHDDVPWAAKMIIVVVVSYALSPIDLIPDFIPILGYLDDLILLPLGIVLAIKLIPKDIWKKCKIEARQSTLKSLPRSKIAAMVIISIWILLLISLYLIMY